MLLGIVFEVRNAIASYHFICSFDSIDSIDSFDSFESIDSINSIDSIDFIDSVVLLFPFCQFYGLIIF